LSEAHDMNAEDRAGSGLAGVRRNWVIVVLVVVVALAAAGAALARRTSSYGATATILLTPLPQYDQTFLGTGLVRDSGDATLTASTVAQLLDSPTIAHRTARRLGGSWTTSSVRSAVDVKPIANTNVIAVAAHASSQYRAESLAYRYAKAALEVHWRAVAKQLDDRIRILEAVARSTRGSSDVANDLAAVRGLRLGGSDPTLTFRHVRAGGRTETSAVVVIALALLGGLVVGVLAALGIESLRPATRRPGTAGSVPPQEAVATNVLSTPR
jgi:capsular polysaccharide biosynthesis protein